MTLGFSYTLAASAQLTGVRLTQQDAATARLLMYTDGSQNTEIFDDEDALVEGAMKLHDALIIHGWRLCPEPARLWVNES